MNHLLTALLVALAMAPAFSQDKADLATCLKAVLSSPELEREIAKAWQGQDALYISNGNPVALSRQPLFERLFQELSAEDLSGLDKEVRLLFSEKEPYYLDVGSVMEVSGVFRGDRLSLALTAGLTDENRRKALWGSFVLERQDAGWSIVKQHVEVK